MFLLKRKRGTGGVSRGRRKERRTESKKGRKEGGMAVNRMATLWRLKPYILNK